MLEALLQKPKCELHLHLEGVISLDTLWSLHTKYHLNLVKSRKELSDKLHIHSLAEFIDCFINVLQPALRKAEDLFLVGQDLIAYLQRNTICYAEVFFSPTKLVQQGLAYESLAEVLQQITIDAQQYGCCVRFLIDVSRSFGVDNAMYNLQQLLKYRKPAIIGIGLGGAERQNPAQEYKEVFAQAHAEGLHCVAHAGEDADATSIKAAIAIGAERIGHATSLGADPQLIELMKERQIPLEICLTSNLITGRYVKKIAQHPLREFFDQQLLVSLHSDDPTFFQAELNDEYRNAVVHCGFSTAEIKTLMLNAVHASFADPEQKEQLCSHLV